MRGGAISITTILWLVLSTGVRADELDYQARAGCPSRAEFERRLASRVRARPGNSLSISVRIGDEATLTLHDGATLVGERTLHASTCEEAVDALAFVAALLLEQRAHSEPPTPAIQEPPKPRPKRARTPPTPANTEPEQEPPPSQTNTLPEPEPVPVPVPVPVPKPAPIDREPPPPPPRTTRDLAMHADLAPLLTHGLAPTIRPGIATQVGIAWTRAVRLDLAIGVRAMLPHTQRTDQGEARYRWASASLRSCVGPALPRLHPAICIDAELGRIRAEGRDTDQPRDVRSPWFALGPALSLGVPLVAQLHLITSLGLLVPLTRDRFTLGGREVHRVPPATFRGAIGLALEFE